jgi:molybdate transport system ATP-binding protein
MSNPAHAPLIGRFQAGAVLDCMVESHDKEYQLSTLRFADGILRVPLLELPPGSAVRARLRARDVAIASELPAGISITNRLAGVVDSLTVREMTYVDVGILLGATRIRALVTRESVARLGLAPGARVWALIKSVALDSRTLGYTRRDRA